MADMTDCSEKCSTAIELLLKILLQLKDDSKGGRFRNNQDALQLYIKDIVNALKDCLGDLYRIIAEHSELIPELGPSKEYCRPGSLPNLFQLFMTSNASSMAFWMQRKTQLISC